MREIPNLETQRLLIRPFEMDDLHAVHAVLERCFGDGSRANDANAIEERHPWLQWASMNPHELAKLSQPPYGDRAIVLKATGALIGAVGLVPCLDAFDQLPSFGGTPNAPRTAEMGLFWAVDPAHQNKGYATEAARLLIDFMFGEEKLKRIVATTEYDNFASQAVMTKLGMRLERNPFPEPPWLQVVGILESHMTLA